jgi:hypothetical protein
VNLHAARLSIGYLLVNQFGKRKWTIVAVTAVHIATIDPITHPMIVA